ncbi:hypothetical protein C1X29_23310 [Pseudomonas sp. GW456-12-10-14-LB2]|nr:hypothetical protein C1X29_23310 [Pseudomonas sp. GW456-12-10-14-LB2]
MGWCGGSGLEIGGSPEKPPHPSPLPEGEGTDWGMLQRCIDLILLYRIHNRLVFFRSMYNARHLGRLPLPPGEGWGEGKLLLF